MMVFKDQLRLETTSENIARDMSEGRFPERSEPQVVVIPEAERKTILTSEAEAMVAAALRGAAAHGDAWIAVFGDVEIKHTPANAYAADAVLDYQDAILALIPQPASAALDKLIAEGVEAERERVTRIAASLFPGGYDNNRIKIEDRLSEIAAKGATP